VSWRDVRVFVTGATGLAGSWLVRELSARGADVVALVRDRVTPWPLDRAVNEVRGSVEDLELVTRAINEWECRVVFHLAAQTIVGTALRDPVSTFTSNVAGTWSVLEACRRAQTVERIVIASSDKALSGRHPYDVSKACADRIAESYAASYELPVVIARFCNLFGPGDLNWNRIVPGTLRAALSGERPVIRSDGTPVREYLYVKDAVDAYLLVAEGGVRGSAYDFSENRPLTVLQMCELALAAAGRPDLEPRIEASAI
jgi:CDP-glucose 4,6-dehydratase